MGILYLEAAAIDRGNGHCPPLQAQLVAAAQPHQSPSPLRDLAGVQQSPWLAAPRQGCAHDSVCGIGISLSHTCALSVQGLAIWGLCTRHGLHLTQELDLCFKEWPARLLTRAAVDIACGMRSSLQHRLQPICL